MDPNRQYTADQLRGMGMNPDQLSNGMQWNGYTVRDNGNGTRSFSGGGGGGGNNGGGGGAGNYNPPDWNSFFNQQKSDTDAFSKQYSDKVNSQESVSSIWDRLGQQFDLPNLTKSANDLTQTLADIPQTQAGATRGFDVNESQLQKIISDQIGKIAPLAQRATGAAQTAGGLVSGGMNAALQEEQRQLQPLEMQGKMLADRLSRELTGFTTDAQQKLDMYMEKMREGQQLNIQQMQDAAALSRQESDHAFQSQQLQQQFSDQKDLLPLQTNEAIRQYNATTGRNAGGVPYDMNSRLNNLRAQNGTANNNMAMQQPPSYFTPNTTQARSNAHPQQLANQNILQRIGGFFHNLLGLG